MIKIVIHPGYGGFALSEAAYEFLGMKWDGYGFEHYRNSEHRADPRLVECVEKLGEAAGRDCKLKIVEIPDGVDWTIEEYDGSEWVAEKHRTWS